MSTLENIHDIIDKKISISLDTYKLLNKSLENNKHLKNKDSVDYIFNRNLFTLNVNKDILTKSIEEYEISSTHFIFTYNKIILMEEINNKPESYKLYEAYEMHSKNIEESFLKNSIKDLINIFKSNNYEYKSYKTIGNKLMLCNYGNISMRNKSRLKKVYEDYKLFISKCNIVDNLDKFINSIHSFFKVYVRDEDNISEFVEYINRYNKLYLSIDKDAEPVYDVCNCGNKMIIQSNTSELLCVRCGYVMYLIGSVTEENQLFAQEGNRVSHGSYDPARHCKFWIERIQAKESTIIPEEYIEKIKRSIKKDRIDNLKSITVKQFRAYLKQNNLSKLNDHIPLIKKIITGYIPPQLTYREQQLLFIYFDKATKSYDKIKPPNKKNSLYYPFLIYKILDIIITDESKKNKLLSCIHLQSYETLIDNDKIWYGICEQNDCFNYKATDKTYIV